MPQTLTAPVPLPPGFELAAETADPIAAAVAAGRAGADPGQVYWSGPGPVCAAAIVLTPDRAVSAETLRHLALLAIYDALATLAPPQAPVELVLPDAVLIDGARVGAVHTAQAEGAVPAWAVAGFALRLASAAADPGDTPDETCLAEEGFGDVTAGELLGCFCRHLLVWVDAWQDEGAPGLARTVARRVQGARR